MSTMYKLRGRRFTDIAVCVSTGHRYSNAGDSILPPKGVNDHHIPPMPDSLFQWLLLGIGTNLERDRMTATKEDIREWLNKGREEENSHMIVACDTFDHSYYPVYVSKSEDVRQCIGEATSLSRMTTIMEVYSYSMDLEQQLNENRVYNITTPDSQEGAPNFRELLEGILNTKDISVAKSLAEGCLSILDKIH